MVSMIVKRPTQNPSPFSLADDKVVLKGCVLLSCGCGTVTARWATISQGLQTKIPHVKPKASKLAKQWIEENGLKNKYSQLSLHKYGVVVGRTENGIELIDIMSGAPTKTVAAVGDLIRRNKEYESSN